jgi:serine/threonine protein kinase
LIFEMLYGQPPFHEPEISPMALYSKISKGPSIIQWPPFFVPRASDLILKLMETDPSKRYGNMRNGAGDVFAHPWFKEVVWQNLLTKNISPPYIPRTISDGDASAYVVPFSAYSLPSISADLTCCPVLNVTRRTKLHPSTDDLDWTSSVIFSKSGITRREGPRADLHALRSVLLYPPCCPSQVSHLRRDLILHRKPVSKCTPVCCVFQHILKYSVSYTCPHDRLPQFSFFLFLPIGL